MTTQVREIVSAKELAATIENIYTATATTLISAISVNNISSSEASYTAHLVAPGDAPTISNQVATGVRVFPNESDQVPTITGQVLATGTSLHMFSSDANALTVRVSGVEFLET